MILSALLATAIFSASLDKQSVGTVCAAVAKHEIENFNEKLYHPLYWTNGAFYIGVLEWGKAVSDTSCINFLKYIGDKYNWDMCYRTYHADDICVGNTFIGMYDLFGEEKMLRPARERAFWIASHPSDAPLRIDDERGKKERWSWADALFMAPPVYAALYRITGERIFVDFMDKEYRECIDSLYDRKYHLVYRDCVKKQIKESNGKPQFWSRGCGWVFAGLPMVIQNLPEDHPSRQWYIDLFKDLALGVLSSQDKSGAWHCSLLDQVAYPLKETSGGSLFCYGLAWGINNGVLKGNEYVQCLKKGWKSLVEAVSEDGTLGYVQPAGHKPRYDIGPKTSFVFGTGPFLLAGSEVYKYAK